MRRSATLLVMVLLAGCKSSSVNDGYAVDISMTVDSRVTTDDLARAVTLDLEVTGAESFSAPSIPVAGKFDPQTRTAGIRYRPRATSGTIDVRVALLDGAAVVIASGSLAGVQLKAGTQVLAMTLNAGGGGTCGDGVLDPGEKCDPGAGSAKPCPQSATDCDDQNPCTADTLTGANCQAACTHAPQDNGSCMVGAATGVCLGGSCCTGCISNGVCAAGTSDAHACGTGGNSCFDCTQSSATSSCNGGNCSGCDQTSCTKEGRTCGTSSCGYTCGGCPDGCSNGTLTHYACVNKTCQMNGSGNCGLYSACASSTTCASNCTGDNGCVATAWCGGDQCKPKGGVGSSCSAEGTGDHECSSPYVCSWLHTPTSGICVATRCTGCAAARPTLNDCGGFIDNGYDPRNACQGYSATVCHQNYCAGLVGDPMNPDPAQCDTGLDAYGTWRTCGSTSCTNDASGMGVVTGNICAAGNVCKAGSTLSCTDGLRTCFPCNAAHTACNYGAPYTC